MISAELVIASKVKVGDIINVGASRHVDPDRFGVWVTVTARHVDPTGYLFETEDANNTPGTFHCGYTRGVWRNVIEATA